MFDGLKWTLIRVFSTKSDMVWTPKKSGNYVIKSIVKDSTGKATAQTIKYSILG